MPDEEDVAIASDEFDEIVDIEGPGLVVIDLTTLTPDPVDFALETLDIAAGKPPRAPLPDSPPVPPEALMSIVNLEQLPLPLSDTRLFFFHYMVATNLSRRIDQTATPDYTARVYRKLGTTAEGGVHLPYGCWARDIPLETPGSTSPTWREENMAWEFDQMAAAGADGVFALLAGNTGLNHANAVRLLDVAATKTMKVILQPDCNGSWAMTPAQLADWLAPLAAKPANFRHADGSVYLSPHYAQRQWRSTSGANLSDAACAAKWAEFKTEMAGRGVPVRLLFVFDSLSDSRRDTYLAVPGLSEGMGVWGNRSPATNSIAPRVAQNQALIARGQTPIIPVAVEDERPRSGIYDECEGVQNYKTMWDIALQSAQDAPGLVIVQGVTWNDIAEGSAQHPSLHKGWSTLDLMTYFLARFKSGSGVLIQRDTVVLAHRSSFSDDRGAYVPPAGVTPKYQVPREGTSTPADIISSAWLLTAAATARIWVGSQVVAVWNLNPGLNLPPRANAPALRAAEPGTIRAEIIRDDVVVAEVTSPYRVYARGQAPWDDKSYRWCISGRTPVPQVAPSAPLTARTLSEQS